MGICMISWISHILFNLDIYISIICFYTMSQSRKMGYDINGLRRSLQDLSKLSNSVQNLARSSGFKLDFQNFCACAPFLNRPRNTERKSRFSRDNRNSLQSSSLRSQALSNGRIYQKNPPRREYIENRTSNKHGKMSSVLLQSSKLTRSVVQCFRHLHCCTLDCL